MVEQVNAMLLKEVCKNELVRHLLASLVYRTTQIIHDAPESYPKISIGNGVRIPEKVLGHINSLIQLSNRFWSPYKPISMANLRKNSDKVGWEREVDLFYKLSAQFDATLTEFMSPRLYSPEKILQGPFMGRLYSCWTASYAKKDGWI
jgi:hypothetical protein